MKYTPRYDNRQPHLTLERLKARERARNDTAPVAYQVRASEYNYTRARAQAVFYLNTSKLLQQCVYGALLNGSRELRQAGFVIVLRHLHDHHLVPLDTDPLGLKLYVAPAGTDRRELENQIHNPEAAAHLDYFAVVANPSTQTIGLEFHVGGLKGDCKHYYDATPETFDLRKVDEGMAVFMTLMGVTTTHS